MYMLAWFRSCWSTFNNIQLFLNICDRSDVVGIANEWSGFQCLNFGFHTIKHIIQSLIILLFLKNL